MSPVFHREEGYVYKIYSNEEERKHIHVIKAEKEAKFWLEPEVELEHNDGFSTKEIKNIIKTLEIYGDLFKQQYERHIRQRIDD